MSGSGSVPVISSNHSTCFWFTGSNNNKWRFYSGDLKIAVHLELLARTDPPILRRGVTKAVSEKFDVPLRVV
jgi:hypothetical protein